MTRSPTKVLIVDDEPVARRRITRMLADFDDFSVVGEAANGEEALAAVDSECPDVILLDVEMPVLDGMSAAERLVGIAAPLIVFVTAYDRFAARAFTLDAADYLLKPYDAERFGAMISRVRRRIGLPVVPAAGRREHLLTLSRGEARLLPVLAIERIDAAGNYVEVIMAGGTRHLVRDTVNDLADDLPAPFVRIARSTIIRTDRVVSAASAGHGDATIVLANGDRVRMSRRYRHVLEGILSTSSRD